MITTTSAVQPFIESAHVMTAVRVFTFILFFCTSGIRNIIKSEVQQHDSRYNKNESVFKCDRTSYI